MNRSNRRLFPLLAVLLATLPACYSLDVTAQAGYAQMSLSGDIGYFEADPGPSTSDPSAPKQDIDSAFGIGNSEGAPYGRASVDCGVPILTVSGFAYKTTGSGTLQEGFGGIPAATDVDSSFEVLDIKTTYVFEIPIGPVSIAPGIGVDYLDMKLRVVNPDPVLQEVQTANLSLPIPFAVVRGEVDLKWFNFVGELGYMSADVEDLEARLVDIEAMLMVRPVRWAHLFLGYRSIVLDAKGNLDNDYVDADVTLSGFMFGGGFEF
jgi:hypothetical protein